MDKTTLYNADAAVALKLMSDNVFDSLVTDPPAGISLMNKTWDEFGGMEDWILWFSGIAADCLRVLKPGAHGVVWSLPRTSHWTGLALHKAGFEIRDVVTHIYGSGFPKSKDISKAIDKAAGATRISVGSSKNQRPNSNRGNDTSHGKYGKVWEDTLPTTAEAKQWEGWGTTLKPAAEFWFLVRKPTTGNLVDNIKSWNTGSINIDKCRIKRNDKGVSNKGGFPTNFIITCSIECTELNHGPNCPVETINAQSGVKKGVAKYFYCAKPSAAEKKPRLRHQKQTPHSEIY